MGARQLPTVGAVEVVDGWQGYVSSMTYNSKLQPTQFEISGNVVHQDYDYFSDGRMRTVHNTTDQNFDRSYSYDHAGRILEAKSGADVNGQQFAPTPYHETFGYDAFSNVTARQSDLWNGVFSDTDSASYTDNRRLGWGYDADGRNTTIDTRTYTFDAVGRQTSMLADEVLPNGNHSPVSQTNGYDANGAMIYEAVSGVTRYYLRSSVLGGAIVEEIGSSGQKNVGYVYTALGTQLAQQFAGSVTWKHNTPARTSQYTSNSVGSGIGRTEFDPLGADVPLAAPNNSPPSEGEGDLNFGRFAALMDSRWSDFSNLSAGCSLAWMSASCSGSMGQTNLEAEMRAAFGFQQYDLPGNANEMARGEARYRSIYLNGPVGGYDPEFNRYAFSVTVIYSSGATETKKNPTLDEYYRLITGYLPDSGTVDLEHNTVTIYGGAEYFVSPQKPQAVSLNGKRIEEYQNARRNAVGLSDPCKNFLQRLGIKNPYDIVTAIGNQRAFDGMASTLSLDAAGLQMGNGLSVAGAFNAAKEDRERGLGTLFAMTAIDGGERTRYHVYFSDLPITADSVLHEAIHSFTKLDDDALAKAAGVFHEGTDSSEEFNQALVKNCF